MGNGVNGVEVLNQASSNTIGGTTSSARNVISGNGGTGIVLTGSASNNVVEGDYIGTNAAGSAAVANGVYGVILSGGASNNTIGGLQAAAGDVISGNQTGVLITDAGTSLNWLEGDLIGTNAADTYAVGNEIGVLIQSGATSDAVYSDVISGNEYGVLVAGSTTTGNYIYFDEIGTNAARTIALGNQFVGVYIIGSSGNDVLYDLIADNGDFGILEWSSDTNTYYGNSVYGSIYDTYTV